VSWRQCACQKTWLTRSFGRKDAAVSVAPTRSTHQRRLSVEN
jgi:hypothetical protein